MGKDGTGSGACRRAKQGFKAKWSLGSLAGADWLAVSCLAPFVAFALILLPWTYKALNALSAGDDLARHVGFDVEKLKKASLLFVALAVGVAVAFTGRIGFIGLIVSHISRMLFGADHRNLLLSSFILGPLLLIAADFFSRHLAAPAEIPIGILTSAIGGPFFLYLLLKMRKLGRGL
ncbi:MAG: FecCD family ABC transporter permease [Oligoflexus sp.]